MFESSKLVFLNFIFLATTVQICHSELVPPPRLSLYSPDDPEYTEVLVKRVGDNLTLTCEIKGDRTPRLFVWVIVGTNGSTTQRHFSADQATLSQFSVLMKSDLQLEDSGQYMCSSPPFSSTKFVMVQNRGIVNCARGAFSCGARCVLPGYVCDGRADCADAADERPPVCAGSVCQRPEMLNCSSGRCIPAAACCAGGAPLCLQPGCCLEHAPYSRAGEGRAGEGFMDVEYPALYEDRHSPEDYGFIQSTIYTVTACALIFMIAAVLLVSAVCKMHMKRAALRGYSRAAAAARYAAHQHQHQAPRFPPCYEASRLLEQAAPSAPPAAAAMQLTPDAAPEENSPENPDAGFGLSRLGAIFSSRYRQVPTEAEAEAAAVEVEMTAVSSAAPRLGDYRSPAYCLGGADLFLSPDTGDCGRELNYMTPVEIYRDQMELDRRLTLQLGRFQLSLPAVPRLPRRAPRAATRAASHDTRDPRDSRDTYTLNGRTIRLLGANLENYPRPPPYDVRKMAGPPPLYPARAPGAGAGAEHEHAAGDELPPSYEDLNSNEDRIELVSAALNVIRESGESLNSIIPAIDDENANEIVLGE